MRQLGTVADESAVRRFQDYLLTKGIRVSLEPVPEGWRVWVHNEDDLDAGRRAFADFSATPDAPIYQTAVAEAERLRSAELRRAREAQKNLVNVGAKWRTGSTRRVFVTTLLMAISISVAIFSRLEPYNEMVARFAIVPLESDGVHVFWHPLSQSWYREPWRLVTPIFLHFSLLHILFNMLILVQLGRLVESNRGPLRFTLMVLVIAVVSNVAQYLHNGPMFGGMSGVVYGLFGYLWMKSRYEPESGLYITRETVIYMIAWFVLCLTGLVGNVANFAHGAGLVAGMILGRAGSVWRKLR